MVQGQFTAGGMRHEVTGGASFFKNSEKWGNYIYDYAGTSNIYQPVYFDSTHQTSGVVTERRADNERALFAQDIISLNEQLKLHAGARHVQVKRNEFVDDTTPDRHTDNSFLLPNLALVYSLRSNVSVYSSYAQGLEHG